MTLDTVIFAGVCISSGGKPLTFAALDDKLDVVQLAQWGIAEVVNCLQEYENIQLTVNLPTSKGGHEIYRSLQEKITQIGFQHYSTKNSSRLWMESRADDSYRVFQSGLLPRRTLEGRIQRGLILYDEGLLIHDPMDFFEEITRHKLMQGTLPTEGLYSTSQLDALMMAYVSWLAGNPAEKVLLKGDLFLPAPE